MEGPEQKAPKLQAAIEVLVLTDENGGQRMMARIAMMLALHRHDAETGFGIAPEAR